MLSSELMGNRGVAEETLNAYRVAIKRAATGVEGWDKTLDLNAFSLQGPAEILQPFSSPFCNALRRPAMSPASDVARWKVLKNARPKGSVAVSTLTGARGPNVEKDSEDKIATLKRIALWDFIIDDAAVFASDYENLQATADMLVLQLLKEAENRIDVNGNIAALGAAATPVAVKAAGGSLAAGNTHDFKVAALTWEGLELARRTGYTGAPAIGSGVASIASGATAATLLNDKVTVTWADKPNAVAYDVYDQVNGAGGYLYVGTVEVNKFVLLTDPVLGSAAPAVDTSANPDHYDGAVQLYNAALGTPLSLDAATLTASGGSKSIAELDAVIDTIYARDHIGPNEFWCGPRVRREIIEKIGGSSPTSVQVTLGSDGTELKAVTVNSLFNPHTDESIAIKVDPGFPQGLGIFLRRTSPYDYSRVSGDAIDSLVLKEYWRETFDRSSYKVEFGVSCMKVLRVRSALGSAIIKNIGF